MGLRSAVVAVACSVALVVAVGTSAVALPAKTVTPKKWVHSVCMSMGDWKSQIQQGQSLLNSVQSATDVTQVKDQVLSYLQSTVSATDQLLTSIGKAGTPSVKNGRKVARDFKAGFSQIRDVFVGARDTTQGLDTSDPTQFANSLTSVGTAIDNGANGIKSTFDAIDTKYHPAAIDKAANTDSACASIRS